MLVKHDFVRHIALDLFNTHLAVDLFANETAINEDLASKGNEVWTDNIKVAIDAVSTGGASVEAGGYTTNALDSSANLCRVLFRQVLQVRPQRFDDLNALEKDAATNAFYIPFVAGDSISFKVIYKPEADQHTILDSRATANPVVPVADRSYRIKIEIVASPTNVVVNDSASFNASRVDTD
jgi:hypothetical protein